MADTAMEMYPGPDETRALMAQHGRGLKLQNCGITLFVLGTLALFGFITDRSIVAASAWLIGLCLWTVGGIMCERVDRRVKGYYKEAKYRIAHRSPCPVAD